MMEHEFHVMICFFPSLNGKKLGTKMSIVTCLSFIKTGSWFSDGMDRQRIAGGVLLNPTFHLDSPVVSQYVLVIPNVLI